MNYCLIKVYMSNSTIDDILKRLQALQKELESEIDQLLLEKRELFNYTLEKGKVKFEQGIKALQRHQKQGVWSYLFSARLGHLLTAPFIYSVFFAFIFLDLMVTVYQLFAFRVYGIPRVSRSEYIVIDRHELAYLNIIQKINCIYCGYGNGLLEYVREIAARTEQYWCPIKHARRSKDPHQYVQQFLDYGDADNFNLRFEKLREDITDIKNQDLSGDR